jgi:O-antigen/teichoic acid export membrane protein
MTSHRQIFRSSAIIGGASVINVVISIVKVKLLAVLLGPAGIGLMGLYQNIINMTAKLAGCGMDSSGVRQISASVEDAEALYIARRALWLGNLVLGLAGMVILWLLREPVAQWVFGNTSHAGQVGWLGVGLLLTLIAGSQTALLQGLRRIDDLARVTVLSALVGAIVGVFAVYLMGADGVLWFVLTAPGVNIAVAGYYASRLPHPQLPYDLKAIRQQWLVMLKLGIPFMAAGLLMLITQLAARSIILRDIGLDASGYFQAAWAISMTYVAFVLNTMAMDYFPRLTAVISDERRACQLVNEQSEMALLLAGPALLAMITLAPWVIHLLYAQSFSPAAEILSWQVLGDILKVASFPIGFVFLATGRGGVYIGLQLVWSAAYLGTLIPGIQEWGLVMAGVGYGAAHLCLFVAISIAANRLIGLNQEPRNWRFALLLLLAGGITVFLKGQSVIASYTVGLLATLLFGIYSLRRLDQLIDLTGWLRQKLA